MNRHRLELHSGVKGVDVRLDDPTGPYYLAEDVHQLLRRVQQQRFHTAQCRCWDCDALQKDIAATLAQGSAQEPRPAHTAAHDCACEECVKAESRVNPRWCDQHGAHEHGPCPQCTAANR
jgi:hypothetical protein